MKRILLLSICIVAAAAVLAVRSGHSQTQFKFQGYTRSYPISGLTQQAIQTAVAAPNQIPLWNYSVTAAASLGGQTFTGTMVGRSPFARGKTTTTINLQIIPLIFKITDSNGTITYDPTIADPCAGNRTGVSIIQQSPLFTNNTYNINGVNVGNTQYIDAFQRASFWSVVGGTPYHLILNPTVLPAFTVTVNNTAIGVNDPITPSCGHLGIVDLNAFDNFDNSAPSFIQGLIKNQLAGSVTPGTFPMFLTSNVVFSDGNPLSGNCCILGYHSGFTTGNNLQIYSPFSLTTNGLSSGFVGTLSHEIAEAVDDPTGVNATPAWGQLGQVQAPSGQAPTLDNGGCQNNLETGDPLSPGFGTPTSPFTIQGANGLSYQIQELAFFSWFFGGPSLGAGGKYSSHGTLAGAAKPCPPGGSN